MERSGKQIDSEESSSFGNQSRDGAADLPIPPNLQAKLEAFQQRLWSIKIGEGALAGLVGLAISYLIVFVLDRFFDTPLVLRYAILAVGFAVPMIGIPLRWHRWVRQQRTLEQIARLLKRHSPRLGDELLGIVELARSSAGGASPALVEAAMKQVDERVADQDFDDAVPARHYATWLASAISLLGLTGLLTFLVSDATENALDRWIAPWKGVKRYTFAQLKPDAEKVIVPYAESFDLQSELADSTEWKPNKATVKLPGKTRLSSARDDDAYAFEVPPQKEDGELKLRVGDHTRKIEVTPLARPELTDLVATLRLPDYLRYESDPVVPIRAGTISVVEGATATFTGTASRELAQVNSEDLETTIRGAAFSTGPIEVRDTITKTISWSDVHGLQAKDSLELKVIPKEDEKPDVFASQLQQEKVVLVDEVVSFDLSASDDFGVKELGLEWFGEYGAGKSGPSTKGEKAVAAGAPEKKSLETRATFSAIREGIEPQTIQVRAFAADYFPDRERSYSPTFVLHVLSPAQHAEWLTREFGKWFRNAREVYEREQQLYETNRNLRELSAAELDTPESRRKLKEQASAESSNARRLDALTGAGRDLVRHATKNDEFDAERLESWASMMRKLDDISKNRMPSVANLVQQASRAEGIQSPSTPQLPSTTLSPEESDSEPPANSESPAQQKLDDALQEQSELLSEFAKVTDQLQEILSSLEASTFVKRLKAAAKKQTELAKHLNATLQSGFGLPKSRVEQNFRVIGEETAEEQTEQSGLIYDIQTDLEAYYQRKQDDIFLNVLQQMKDLSVVANIKMIGRDSKSNLSGRSITASEYWADTLDRWAEELVTASECKSNQSGNKASLPPEIVLKIMKVLREEMYLRDETREMQSARPALSPDVYRSKVRPLETTQAELRERIDKVMGEISSLENAREQFQNELQLLAAVSDVMRESRAVLARPDTGVEAIAAQTEAIELLLQSKRQNQNNSGNGGGGSSPGNGGSAGGGNGSALSDIQPGPAGTTDAAPASRSVDQTTGKAGRELPEEFRRGLDSYFNELESN